MLQRDTEHYDAILVGGRLAGATTAVLLAQRGARVLVLERDRVNRPTLSTHLFFPDTLAVLRDIGALDAVLAVPAPRLQWIRFPYVAAPIPEQAGHAFALCIRREVLDPLVLARAAEHPLITVREEAQVTGLLWDDGRVCGVRYRLRRSRAEHEARGRIVIGADGRASFVAKAVKAATYDAVPPLYAWYYTYCADVPIDSPPSAFAVSGEFPALAARYAAAFLFPADHGLTLVGFGVDHAAFPRMRRNARRWFWEGLRCWPEIWDRVGLARQETPIYGTGELPNFFRTAAGPGWALVGDAGCHKDPHSVQGIGDAMRSARLLAHALQRWWSGEWSEAEALAWYQQARDADLRPMYDFTTFRLQQAVGEDVWEAYSQLTWQDAVLAQQRVAAMTHAVDPATVYSPAAVRAAVEAAGILQSHASSFS
ncbi:MAG: NAD(P)/FAD-dependent oxidoreductase [Thermorudis peleae]|nr:NAD(P)/FAD-dependent oxidoreductase [Thermorudis peleae]